MNIGGSIRRAMVVSVLAVLLGLCAAPLAQATSGPWNNVGLEYAYTYRNCKSTAIVDPINVYWFGSEPTPHKVASVLERTEEWEYNDITSPLSAISIDHQDVWRTEGSCQVDLSEPATGIPIAYHRRHIRLFPTYKAKPSGGYLKYVVGDAHEDQLVLCGDLPPLPAHRAENYPKASESVGKAWFEATEEANVEAEEYWGNSDHITQCDGTKPHSEGWVLKIHYNAKAGKIASTTPEAATLPEITGNPAVGSTLTAQPGEWVPAQGSFVYEWGTGSPETESWTVLQAGSSPTWTPTASDVGKAIAVRVRPSSRPSSEAVPSPPVVVEGKPPTVTTEGVSELRPFSAVIHGSINPNSILSNGDFEWGTTPSYGSLAPEGQFEVSGNAPVPVEAKLTGLQACTSYHYRLRAEDVVGLAAAGGDAAFTTRGLPKPVVHGIPETWVKYGPTSDYITAIAPCAGAIHSVAMEIPAGEATVFSQEFPCGCEESVTSGNINLSGQPTGVRSVGVYAEDPWGDRAEELPHPSLYVDHTPPAISVSGSATEAKEGQIGEGSYALSYTATDGSASAPQSGPQEAWIEVDGSRRETNSSLCEKPLHIPLEGCFTLSGALHFTGEELGVGEHKLTVHARDWVGNESESSTYIVVHAAARERVGPGSLNLATGDYSLSPTDVSVNSGPVTLSVGRVSHSRAALGAADETLGPGWALSLPEGGAMAWRGLAQLANGSALLTSSSGQRYIFQLSQSGGYVNPPGLQADTLVAVEGSAASYRLTEANGNVTTFERSGGEGRFAPTRLEQAAASGSGINPITYEYAVDANAPGKPVVPVKVLAPAPPGVSCAPTMNKGCRALSLVYGSKTTASGEEPGQWGEYAGRLTFVLMEGYEANNPSLVTRTLAQYAYDSAGRLRAEWNPLIAPALKTVYGYDAEGHVTAAAPPGQEPWAFAYAAANGDPNPGRLASVSRNVPELARTATWTLHYGVPVSGGEAPDVLEPSEVARWAQQDDPMQGTAIFPPDEVPPAHPKNYARADVYYLDALGRAVDTAPSGHGIEVRELDNDDNVVRTLSAANRLLALEAGGESAQHSRLLDTQTTYNAAGSGAPVGSEVTDVLGPQHQVRLESGTEVAARAHTHNEYDQGEPGGGPHYLLTTSTEGAQYSGGEADVRKVTRSYSGEGGLGWKLHKPTATAIDPEGLDIVHQSAYDPATGQLTETAMPASRETAPKSYLLQFGAAGSGQGQLTAPAGVAVARGGQVYVADKGNHRVEELSATGRYLQTFGPECAVSKALSTPVDVEVDAHGNVWVLDSGTDRVVEYNNQDECVASIGAKGSAPGQLENPSALTLDYSGHLWIADTGNHRIQELSTTGEPLAQFGTKGTGEVQFEAGPTSIALDAQGNVWASDPGNYRLQELSPAGGFIRAIGSKGSGPGQFASGPGAVAVDPQGQVWALDPGGDRVEGFTEEGKYLGAVGSQGTGAGQLENPSGAALDAAGDLYVSDAGNSRVQKFQPTLGAPGAHVTHTIYYTAEANSTVPACGGHAEYAGLPCQSGPLEQPETTGVANLPVTTASYDLLDQPATVTQTISTQGNLVPDPSFENGLGGWSAAGSQWVKGGAKLTKASVAEVGKASLAVTTAGAAADEGAAAVIPGTFRAGVSYTASLYVESGAASSLQLVFGDPAFEEGAENSEVTTSGTWTRYSVTWTPKATTDYAQVVIRDSQPGAVTWNVDAVQVTASPATVPYTDGDQPGASWAGKAGESVTLVSSNTRAISYSYDTSGRLLNTSVGSNVGAAVAPTTYEYNTVSGLLATVTANVKGGLSTFYTFNTLGQLISYKDASGVKSEYTYDVDGRPASRTDGQSTVRDTYSGSTGLLSTLTDKSAGKYTAGYNAAGQLTSLGYPNGMTASDTYDPTGEATSVQYVKTSNCGCTWFTDTIVPTIHGPWASQSSTFSSQSYGYDGAGRLAQVQDTPAGQGCTTRVYAYDQDGNRTSLVTHPPASGGGCSGEGGTTEPHRYDSADRLMDDGSVYDALGDIAALPGADAGGGNLASTFYANSRIDNLSQEGETTGYLLDPEGRTYQTVSSGTYNATVLSHYSGPGEAVSWTVSEANGEWVRSIYGINGALAALETNGKPEVLQIADLHGDIVATASASATAKTLASTADTTEFGVPRSGSPPTSSWLGALGLRTEQPSGTVLMGARTYQPQIGRFLQADPTAGGSVNAYAYLFDDPLQGSDPTGEEAEQPEAAALAGEATPLGSASAPGAVNPPLLSMQLEEAPSASPAASSLPPRAATPAINAKP